MDTNEITIKPSVLQKVTILVGGKQMDTFINICELPTLSVVHHHNQYKIIYSEDNTTLQKI